MTAAYVSHVFDSCGLVEALVEAHRVSDGTAAPHTHLVGDTLGDGDGSDATWLRASNDVAVARPAGFMQVLRNLRRLAASRVANDHNSSKLFHHVKQ